MGYINIIILKMSKVILSLIILISVFNSFKTAVNTNKISGRYQVIDAYVVHIDFVVHPQTSKLTDSTFIADFDITVFGKSVLSCNNEGYHIKNNIITLDNAENKNDCMVAGFKKAHGEDWKDVTMKYDAEKNDVLMIDKSGTLILKKVAYNSFIKLFIKS